jgi:hypothetical protein
VKGEVVGERFFLRELGPVRKRQKFALLLDCVPVLETRPSVTEYKVKVHDVEDCDGDQELDCDYDVSTAKQEQAKAKEASVDGDQSH